MTITVLPRTESDDSGFEIFFPSCNLVPLPPAISKHTHCADQKENGSSSDAGVDHSEIVQSFFGMVTPNDTIKKNVVTLRPLCNFIATTAGFEIDNVMQCSRVALFSGDRGTHSPPGFAK